MKKRRAPMVIGIILVVLLLLFLGFSWWMAGFVMTGKRQTLEEAFAWQSERYDTGYYEGLEKTDYTVEGHDGYILHVEFLKNPTPTDKYMILSHGYTDNRFGSLKYVKMYLDLGFNCVFYDLRGHGENASAFTTYGVLEAKDLCRLIEDTRQRYTDISVLGLHGESLGAATTLTSLKYKPQVDFVVADCGFSDIENVLRNGYKSYGIPEGLFNIADFGSRIRYHYALKDMRPIESLSENTIPILFIHGAEDSFIVPKNSEDMKNATAGYAEFYTIPEAGHAESVLVNPDLYGEYVKAYLENVLQ